MALSVKKPFNGEQHGICNAIQAIPRGRVASYGEIAARAGLPRRARLVGRVLREAGEGMALPWHRVVRADGCLAFAPGSAEFIEQRLRLSREGVELRGRRVDMRRFGWQRDLDAELWAPGKVP
jgi:methylated-DNA-protein-cysteine methyltransferase related protein